MCVFVCLVCGRVFGVYACTCVYVCVCVCIVAAPGPAVETDMCRTHASSVL